MYVVPGLLLRWCRKRFLWCNGPAECHSRHLVEALIIIEYAVCSSPFVVRVVVDYNSAAKVDQCLPSCCLHCRTLVGGSCYLGGARRQCGNSSVLLSDSLKLCAAPFKIEGIGNSAGGQSYQQP